MVRLRTFVVFSRFLRQYEYGLPQWLMAESNRERLGVAGFFHTNSRIDDSASLPRRQAKNRIEIEFHDLRDFLHQSRNAQQHVLDRLDVCLAMTSIAGQHWISFDSADHLDRVILSQRCNAELDVPKDFDVDSTKAERQQRPENRIV